MKRTGVAFAVATIFAMSWLPVQAEDYKFTALFIFNFAKYIDWPSQDGDFVIGVLGNDPIIDELKTIAGTADLNGRKMVVKKFSSAGQVEKCGILYVTPGQSDSLSPMVNKFGQSGVLIVTNKPGLAEAGAAINLAMIDGKQRYEINTASLKKSGLSAKPVLFKIGKVIGS
jgi:hypothetical protein